MRQTNREGQQQELAPVDSTSVLSSPNLPGRASVKYKEELATLKYLALHNIVPTRTLD